MTMACQNLTEAYIRFTSIAQYLCSQRVAPVLRGSLWTTLATAVAVVAAGVAVAGVAVAGVAVVAVAVAIAAAGVVIGGVAVAVAVAGVAVVGVAVVVVGGRGGVIEMGGGG